MNRVAVFGGGMGGLAAAHELIERGFEVDVYERRALWGGKARSYGVHGTGAEGRKELPGEHGFRFFPGFYKHIPDTMSRIPFPTSNASGVVLDNLVACSEGELLEDDRKATIFPVRFPESWQEFRDRMRDLQGRGRLGFADGELRHFVGRMLRIMVSCRERRMDEFEQTPWWTFIGAETRSAAYRNLLARGVTRSLVAMRAETASTRTVGDILSQMVYYVLTPGATADRVLNGPTSEVWIEPWRAHLRAEGVRFHDEAKLVRLELGSDRRIARAVVSTKSAGDVAVQADHYIAAVPCEVMAGVVEGALAAAAPSLRGLDQLQVQWMNGVQFYLARDYPMVAGHCIYANSAWSLTSISQNQFWQPAGRAVASYGDGRVKGLLSVDISDWTSNGTLTTTQPADDCERDGVIKETWAQVLAHLQHSGHPPLTDADLLSSHLDHDIEHPPHGTGAAKQLRGRMPVGTLRARHASAATSTAAASPSSGGGSAVSAPRDIDTEPLLVNTINSWAHRPEASTEIPNLFLASDYVRTHTDLATMEGANEAGRRAVNAILDAIGSAAPRCQVWPLHEPILLAPFRALDWLLLKLQRLVSPADHSADGSRQRSP